VLHLRSLRLLSYRHAISQPYRRSKANDEYTQQEAFTSLLRVLSGALSVEEAGINHEAAATLLQFAQGLTNSDPEATTASAHDIASVQAFHHTLLLQAGIVEAVVVSLQQCASEFVDTASSAWAAEEANDSEPGGGDSVDEATGPTDANQPLAVSAAAEDTSRTSPGDGANSSRPARSWAVIRAAVPRASDFMQTLALLLREISQTGAAQSVLIEANAVPTVLSLLDAVPDVRDPITLVLVETLWNMFEHSLAPLVGSEAATPAANIGDLLARHRSVNAAVQLLLTPIGEQQMDGGLPVPDLRMVCRLFDRCIATSSSAADKHRRNAVAGLVALLARVPEIAGDAFLNSGLLALLLLYGSAAEVGIPTSARPADFATGAAVDVEFKLLLWSAVASLCTGNWEAPDSPTAVAPSTAVLLTVQSSALLPALFVHLHVESQSHESTPVDVGPGHSYLARMAEPARRALQMQALSLLSVLAATGARAVVECGGLSVLLSFLRRHSWLNRHQADSADATAVARGRSNNNELEEEHVSPFDDSLELEARDRHLRGSPRLQHEDSVAAASHTDAGRQCAVLRVLVELCWAQDETGRGVISTPGSSSLAETVDAASRGALTASSKAGGSTPGGATPTVSSGALAAAVLGELGAVDLIVHILRSLGPITEQATAAAATLAADPSILEPLPVAVGSLNDTAFVGSAYSPTRNRGRGPGAGADIGLLGHTEASTFGQSKVASAGTALPAGTNIHMATRTGGARKSVTPAFMSAPGSGTAGGDAVREQAWLLLAALAGGGDVDTGAFNGAATDGAAAVAAFLGRTLYEPVAAAAVAANGLDRTSRHVIAEAPDQLTLATQLQLRGNQDRIRQGGGLNLILTAMQGCVAAARKGTLAEFDAPSDDLASSSLRPHVATAIVTALRAAIAGNQRSLAALVASDGVSMLLDLAEAAPISLKRTALSALANVILAACFDPSDAALPSAPVGGPTLTRTSVLAALRAWRSDASGVGVVRCLLDMWADEEARLGVQHEPRTGVIVNLERPLDGTAVTVDSGTSPSHNGALEGQQPLSDAGSMTAADTSAFRALRRALAAGRAAQAAVVAHGTDLRAQIYGVLAACEGIIDGQLEAQDSESKNDDADSLTADLTLRNMVTLESVRGFPQFIAGAAWSEVVTRLQDTATASSQSVADDTAALAANLALCRSVATNIRERQLALVARAAAAEAAELTRVAAQLHPASGSQSPSRRGVELAAAGDQLTGVTKSGLAAGLRTAAADRSAVAIAEEVRQAGIRKQQLLSKSFRSFQSAVRDDIEH
jgi:hypothetical protein